MKTQSLSYQELLDFRAQLESPKNDVEAMALEAVLLAIFVREGRKRQVKIIEDALMELPQARTDAALAALGELQPA